MVDEIVLAIDPALRKIEEILLWKNKLKTVLVFSFVHLVFWLFIIYNVRIYCIMASVVLFFHLLDTYRTKKRRELNKLKNQPAKKVIENEDVAKSPNNKNNNNDEQKSFYSSCLNNAHVKRLSKWLNLDQIDVGGDDETAPIDYDPTHISSLGRYIIYVHSKILLGLTALRKLKQKNKVQYFLVMLLFWSMLVVVGVKIRGLYLSYAMFWLVFFLPPVLHYDLPKKALQKCLPLLEQLDHSMKYERRSVLDKSELLVDVRLPKMGIDDDEQEEEYLRPFKFDENVGRDVLERLDDGEDDDEEDTDEYAGGVHPDEEVEIEEEFEYQVQKPKHAQQQKYREDNDEEDEEDDEDITETRYVVHKVRKTSIKKLNNPKPFDDDDDDDEVDDSMLPNESLPGYMDVTDTGEQSFHFNYGGQRVTGGSGSGGGSDASRVDAVMKGDRVMKIRAGKKNRPSLLDYYGESISSSSSSSTNPTTNIKNNPKLHNEHDIDETFDFLDEELKKY